MHANRWLPWIVSLCAACGGAMRSKHASYPGSAGGQAERSMVGGAAEGDAAITATGDDGVTTGGSAAPVAAGPSGTVAGPQRIAEKMVIEGFVRVEVDDAAETAQALRAEVEKLGG